MGYSIDWSDLEQRIQDQKAALLDTSQNLSLIHIYLHGHIFLAIRLGLARGRLYSF